MAILCRAHLDAEEDSSMNRSALAEDFMEITIVEAVISH